MSVDGQTLAGVKNRVGKWQLISELHRIEREKKAEMRMHNTAKQRFKAKYYKLEQFLDRGKDAADVRMYETHNPGFCYRRNGECRTPQTPSPSPSVDYDDIYSLLFTDGEVDIEKVLCLHLLTAHKTETLTPPTKTNAPVSVIAKNQSPVERLIERSKKKRQEDSVTKLLPTYIIDLKTKKPGEETARKENNIVIRDGRLAARIIINDKIVQLVHIVIAALEHTNPEKMNDLFKMVSNVAVIKEVIEKPHLLDFLSTLNGHTLICSCESFHLTQPFKAVTKALELETTTGNVLAKLLHHIRRNVLQLPSKSTAKKVYSKFQLIKEESINDVVTTPKSSRKAKDTASMSSRSTSSQVETADVQPSSFKKSFRKSRESSASSFRGSKTSSFKKKPDKNLLSTKSSTTSSAHPSFLNFLDDDTSSKGKNASGVSFKGQKSTRADRSKSNKNLRKTEPTVGEMTATEESAKQELIIRDTDLLRRFDIRAVAVMLSDKALAAHQRDLDEVAEDQEISEDAQKSSKPIPTQAKVTIKQMTCPACIQKWKIPLPEPKTSKIKKVSIPTLDQLPYSEFKSGSAQRLSIMIDEEMNKLNSESRRQKPNMSKYPIRDFKNRGSLLSNQTVDTVEMDALDLAKIAQEIKQKETQKKLMKFLSSRV